MDGHGPHFETHAATDGTGGCPFGAFLESETDANIRALILTKVEYLSHLAREDHDRPLVDTLDGPIKELRFGPKKCLRILYSLEQGSEVLLFYGGERKQVRACSPELITEAKNLRAAWLADGKAEEIDVPSIRKMITRKRLKWPDR